jgi:hypothetical protein
MLAWFLIQFTWYTLCNKKQQLDICQ